MMAYWSKHAPEKAQEVRAPRGHLHRRRGRWAGAVKVPGLLTRPQVLNADMDAYWASKDGDKADKDEATAEDGAKDAPADDGEQA